MQPDTLIPGFANPQAWNRYSYVLGNPLLYSDPSGHGQCQTHEDCDDMGTTPMGTGGSSGSSSSGNTGGGGDPHDDDIDPNPNNFVYKKHKRLLPNASGNNLEFNITVGIPLETTEHATVGLLYFSLGVVTDEAGGYQFYYTTLDQKFIPGSSGHMGGFSGENGEKNDTFGLGIGLSKGWIFGEDFRTGKFLGQGDSKSIGVLPISGGVFNPRDKKSNWTGVALGMGGGFTMGSVSTDTKNIGGRIQLPPILLTLCRINGQCGGIY